MKKMRCIILAALLAAALWLPAAALSKLGSRGSEVTKVQQKLLSLGYRPGAADGVYGEQTRAAVLAFQKDHDLVADGIAGAVTLAALGVTSDYGGTANATATERALLARIISAESRGEPYTGQVAVGAVVLNRVKHPSFPNTLSGVIYQNGAFTALVDGQFNTAVAESAYRAADDALSGWDPTGGAVYYYNPERTTSAWIYSRTVVCVIGKHYFAV